MARRGGRQPGEGGPVSPCGSSPCSRHVAGLAGPCGSLSVADRAELLGLAFAPSAANLQPLALGLVALVQDLGALNEKAADVARELERVTGEREAATRGRATMEVRATKAAQDLEQLRLELAGVRLELAGVAAQRDALELASVAQGS